MTDRWGREVAHGDLGYSDWRVLLEYEGRQHAEPEQFGRDVDRYSLGAADGWLVLRDHPSWGAQVLVERYPVGMDPATLHLLMSVSKSVVGITVGALVGQGVIDTEALATQYVPALHESGYAGATVRNLLDMRSGIHFSEDYLDPMAEVRVLEQSFGWAPKLLPDVPGVVLRPLVGVRAARNIVALSRPDRHERLAVRTVTDHLVSIGAGLMAEYRVKDG